MSVPSAPLDTRAECCNGGQLRPRPRRPHRRSRTACSRFIVLVFLLAVGCLPGEKRLDEVVFHDEPGLELKVVRWYENLPFHYTGEIFVVECRSEATRDFPELTIVGGHIGYPWTSEMVALATKYPNVYIDTSAYKANRYPSELVDYLRSHGSKKVLFGSNFPMLAPRDCLAGLGALGLPDGVLARFLGENAARVFRIASE